MEIINGKKIAKKIKNDLAKNIYKLIKEDKRRPGLGIVLIGDRQDSKLYVSLKEKVAKDVGVDTSLYIVNEDDNEEDVIKTIKFLNQDEEIDGILVQLPLPEKFNTDKILRVIKPEKDVDGFGHGDKRLFFSPVLMAIKYSIEESKVKLNNDSAFLFYNSEIFKNEIQNFFKSFNIELDYISNKDFNKILLDQEELEKLFNRVKKNNILISAMGNPGVIGSNFLKNNMIIIDIGITKADNKVLGDFNFLDTKKLDGFITPVPGGIGPITVACLLKNVLDSFLLRQKNKRDC